MLDVKSVFSGSTKMKVSPNTTVNGKVISDDDLLKRVSNLLVALIGNTKNSRDSCEFNSLLSELLERHAATTLLFGVNVLRSGNTDLPLIACLLINPSQLNRINTIALGKILVGHWQEWGKKLFDRIIIDNDITQSAIVARTVRSFDVGVVNPCDNLYAMTRYVLDNLSDDVLSQVVNNCIQLKISDTLLAIVIHRTISVYIERHSHGKLIELLNNGNIPSVIWQSDKLVALRAIVATSDSTIYQKFCQLIYTSIPPTPTYCTRMTDGHTASAPCNLPKATIPGTLFTNAFTTLRSCMHAVRGTIKETEGYITSNSSLPESGNIHVIITNLSKCPQSATDIDRLKKYVDGNNIDPSVLNTLSKIKNPSPTLQTVITSMAAKVIQNKGSITRETAKSILKFDIEDSQTITDMLTLLKHIDLTGDHASYGYAAKIATRAIYNGLNVDKKCLTMALSCRNKSDVTSLQQLVDALEITNDHDDFVIFHMIRARLWLLQHQMSRAFATSVLEKFRELIRYIITLLNADRSKVDASAMHDIATLLLDCWQKVSQNGDIRILAEITEQWMDVDHMWMDHTATYDDIMSKVTTKCASTTLASHRVAICKKLLNILGDRPDDLGISSGTRSLINACWPDVKSEINETVSKLSLQHPRIMDLLSSVTDTQFKDDLLAKQALSLTHLDKDNIAVKCLMRANDAAKAKQLLQMVNCTPECEDETKKQISHMLNIHILDKALDVDVTHINTDHTPCSVAVVALCQEKPNNIVSSIRDYIAVNTSLARNALANLKSHIKSSNQRQAIRGIRQLVSDLVRHDNVTLASQALGLILDDCNISLACSKQLLNWEIISQHPELLLTVIQHPELIDNDAMSGISRHPPTTGWNAKNVNSLVQAAAKCISKNSSISQLNFTLNLLSYACGNTNTPWTQEALDLTRSIMLLLFHTDQLELELFRSDNGPDQIRPSSECSDSKIFGQQPLSFIPVC